MQINWFTIVAQLLNFLILVWLLKRFLYQPILDAIDVREKSIAETLQQAAATQTQATNEQEKFQSLNADLAAKRTILLKETTDAAQKESQKLLAEAGIAADAKSEKRRQERLREVQKLRNEIHHMTATEVFALTRKILSDLAGISLEQSMLTVFSQRLQSMPEDSRSQLVSALISAPSGGILRSSLPLSTEQQQQLQTTIETWAGGRAPLQFETSDALICGIELSAKGQQTNWNIDANLNQLETALTASLTKANNRANGTTSAEPANE